MSEKILPPEEAPALPSSEAAPHLTYDYVSGDTVGDGAKGEWRDMTEGELDGAALETAAEAQWPHRWHTLCWSLASGLSQREAAAECGYTESRVSLIMRNPDVREKIERIKKDHGGQRIERQVARIAPTALSYMERVIDGREGDASPGNRLHAAQWVLEKHTGKPKQEIVSDGGLGAAQVIAALEALRHATQARAAGTSGDPIEIEVTPQADPIDAWVTANVPELKGEKS